LSDGGVYNPTTADSDPGNDSPVGLRFTTNVAGGLTWAEFVAQSYGLPLSVNRQVNFGVVGVTGKVIDKGGLDYAEGGARLDVDAPNNGVINQPLPTGGTVPVQLATQRSLKTQIAAYLAAKGSFKSSQLVLMQGGANDFFAFLGGVAAGKVDPSTATATVTALATSMVTHLKTVKAAGATNLLYSNLPDLGLTPNFRGTPLQTLATTMANGYNAAVAQGIAGTNIPIYDTAALIREATSKPDSFKLVNVTQPGCTSKDTSGAVTSLLCTAQTLVAPTVPSNYLFADGVHPTTAGHVFWGTGAATMAKQVIGQ
jgi:outer membrane lipase/esterase